MKKIAKAFKKFQKMYPKENTLMWFAEAVRGQNMTRKEMTASFNELVHISDYDWRRKKIILKGLAGLLQVSQNQQNFWDTKKCK